MKKIVSILTACAVVAAATAAEATERWRVQLVVSETLPAVGKWFTDWAESVNSTGVDLQVKLFEPGEIVPPLSIFDAVRDGKVPAGVAILNFSSGSMPAGQLLTGAPFGLNSVEYASWYYSGEGEKLTQELLEKNGVHGMLCLLTGPETGGWFRQPIESADQLKGLKFRTAGLGAAAYEKAGASVSTLPNSEIFPALEKGVIDAAEASTPVVDEILGFYKVAPYAYLPGWHQPMAGLHLLVNLDAWNALSKPQQTVLETACEATTLKSYVGIEAAQADAVASLEAKGAIFNTFPPDILETFHAAADAVIEEQAAKDEDFKRILESMRAHKAKLAAWSGQNKF